MHKLLYELLRKRKIETIDDLSTEERKDFENYQHILDGQNITVEKIKEFCERQVKIIEDVYASGDRTDKQDMFSRASLHVYLNLLKAIEAPEAERKNIEQYLTNLINS